MKRFVLALAFLSICGATQAHADCVPTAPVASAYPALEAQLQSARDVYEMAKAAAIAGFNAQVAAVEKARLAAQATPKNNPDVSSASMNQIQLDYFAALDAAKAAFDSQAAAAAAAYTANQRAAIQAYNTAVCAK